MTRQGKSANQLGAEAGLAPNTVSNFLKPAKREHSASGKQPSGKLTELEMICSALGTDVRGLLAVGNVNVDTQAQAMSHPPGEDAPTASAVRGGQLPISLDTEFKKMSAAERRRFAHLWAASFDEPPEVGITLEGELWIREDKSTAKPKEFDPERQASVKPATTKRGARS